MANSPVIRETNQSVCEVTTQIAEVPKAPRANAIPAARLKPIGDCNDTSTTNQHSTCVVLSRSSYELSRRILSCGRFKGKASKSSRKQIGVDATET